MNYLTNNLYRGKLKSDNGIYKKGQWVYGDFVRLLDGKRLMPYIYGCGEVFLESIGQSTGRKIGDTEVFDGDILQNSTDIFVVFWDEKFLQWCTMNKEGKACFNLNTLLTDEKRPCKIIGNVLDNPELLKGEI